MTYNFWCVMQAVGKKNIGIKIAENFQGKYEYIAVFPTKEDAREYLTTVLDSVINGQKMGIRTKRNLDADYKGGLDFLILPCKLEVKDDQMIKRGWTP